MEDFVDVSLKGSALTWEYYLILGLSVVGTASLGGIVAHTLYGDYVTTAISVVIAVGFIAAANYKQRERSIKKFVSETYRPKWPVTIEAEVTKTGLAFKQFGITTIYDWEIISSVGEAGDAIYFQNIFDQFSAVRLRAFANESEKTQFIETATNYISASRQPLQV